MVILYNRNYEKLAKKRNVRKYKKNKHIKSNISRRVNTQRITPVNKNFLKSIGLKVLV